MQTLSEAQRHLFHTTELSRLRDILKTNTLRFTYADATHTESSISKGFPFYLSTSREKFGGYARHQYNKCELVLNGQKLERTGKIKFTSADYWAGSSQKSPAPDAETEERLLSHDQVLRDASNYIDEIHVYIHSEIESFTFIFVSMIKSIIQLAIERSIPIFFYVRIAMKSAFDLYKMQKSDRAMDVKAMWDFLKQNKLDNLPNDTAIDYVPSSYLEENDKKTIEAISNIINRPEEYIKSTDDMTKIEYSVYRNIMGFVEGREYLKSSIHNNRFKEWEELTTLAKSIRGNGYTNFNDAITITAYLISIGRAVKHIFDSTTPSDNTSLIEFISKIGDVFYDYPFKNKLAKPIGAIKFIARLKQETPTSTLNMVDLRFFLIQLRKELISFSKN
jgi:hypothetical protein